MKKQEKHILLISYVFPPYPGIGGRRWAKFAKYLAKKGFVVHVICAQNPTAETSLFINDVQHQGVFVYPVPTGYPYALIKPIRSIIDKINYRVRLSFLKLVVKGNYYDRGIKWKKTFIHKAKQLIEKNSIENAIVTGAPFSVLFDAAELKLFFPGLKMIADLRDPWTWGTGYGMQILSASRKKEEKRREAHVMEKYDVITVPTGEMKETLCEQYPGSLNKIQVLSHAYDAEEIKLLPKTTSTTVRFVFYGTLYSGIEDIFQRVIQLIVSNSGTVDIFLFGDNEKKRIVEKNLASGIKLFGPIQPNELFSRFGNYDYVLIIQPASAKNFITTKIFEIIYSRTPIVLVAEEGELSKFIMENNLGIHIHPGNLEHFQEELNRNNKVFAFDSFPISDYSFEFMAGNIISYFD